MAVNVDDKIRKLSPAKCRKVEARASELIAEETSLRVARKRRLVHGSQKARSLKSAK